MDYADWRLGPPQMEQIPKAPTAFVQPSPEDLARALKGNYFKRTWEGALTEPEVFEVDAVPAAYQHLGGWTVCDKDKRSCQIFMMRNPMRDKDCILKHERMHVAGIDHPDDRQGYICP